MKQGSILWETMLQLICIQKDCKFIKVSFYSYFLNETFLLIEPTHLFPRKFFKYVQMNLDLKMKE